MALSLSKLAQFSASAFAILVAVNASAKEQDSAPITYAAVGVAHRATVDEPNIHYGYGPARRAERTAPIDLRGRVSARPSAGATAEPGDDAPASRPSDMLRDRERPDWLESERTGAPYEAKGRWYVPTAEPGYTQTGIAVRYDSAFANRLTATGERYEPTALTAAHPTLPVPSLVQVHNVATGREVILRVNDRGPFTEGRLIGLSAAAADALGVGTTGDSEVTVRYLGPAPKRLAADAALRGRAEASAPLKVSASTGRFSVQVGAFSEKQSAERVGARIASAGSVSIEPVALGARTMHRVRLAGFQTRSEAEAARSMVTSLGFTSAVVAIR